MSASVPVIYLLHGDDEFAISQFIAEIETRLGDPATASMNTSRLDGRTYNPDDLLTIAGAMPFLARRRLVILYHPLARLNSPTARERFKEQLSQVPDTTALLLVEDRPLTEEKERRKNKLHWLERWALENSERVYLKEYSTPKGAALARWIQGQAKAAGGAFTPQGAAQLAALVGDDPRHADQEIQKLLAYVNYSRPVDEADVENLTADSGQGDIFAMVDALGNQDPRLALGMLHRLLETQDPFSIFGMVVRQFRLLLLVREMMEAGGQKNDIARELKLHPFVVDKISTQARHFSLGELELVYHRLLDFDEAIKTGQVDGELALDTFTAAFTHQPSSR